MCYINQALDGPRVIHIPFGVRFGAPPTIELFKVGNRRIRFTGLAVPKPDDAVVLTGSQGLYPKNFRAWAVASVGRNQLADTLSVVAKAVKVALNLTVNNLTRTELAAPVWAPMGV
jgi:hypothetical protein